MVCMNIVGLKRRKMAQFSKHVIPKSVGKFAVQEMIDDKFATT